MDYEKCAFISHSHLLRMAALSQRAVDYATKAYELHDSRYHLQLQDTERNLRDLQTLVAERGRILQADGSALDDRSVPGSCTLRIYGGLQITFAAAKEIAQIASFIEENRQGSMFSSAGWGEAARFANTLVTLNTVALANRQRRAAELVVRSRHHSDWPRRQVLPQGEQVLRQADGASALEECVALCLREIADQAVEIARSIVCWLDSEGCSDRSVESVLSLRQVSAARPSPSTGVRTLIASQIRTLALDFASQLPG